MKPRDKATLGGGGGEEIEKEFQSGLGAVALK